MGLPLGIPPAVSLCDGGGGWNKWTREACRGKPELQSPTSALEPSIYPESAKTNAIMSRSSSSRAACLLLAMLTTWLGASATPRLQVMRLFARRCILTHF